MESMCMLSLCFAWVMLSWKKHPLELSGCLLLVGVFNSLLVCCGMSGMMGFSLFMAMVGGVLVLIAFCVALVPYKKVSSQGWISSGGSSLSSGTYKWYFRFIGVGLFGAALVYSLIMDPFGTCLGRTVYFRTGESFLCFRDWAVAIIFLSVYLMCAVVVSINVSSKHAGALLSKSWGGEDAVVEKKSLDNLSEIWSLWRFRF
uniref:NADH dehydrogenase subunit 6 n=1 Tax=Teredothyra matocotana TaxID=2795841 RepID=UPI002029183D|nr:NADH dehydrogenase subunit 6 [Teredothyra matocotana]UPX89340.1 NADH dehydrogenase subunit 6 [Teredothyra matocotana]